MPLTLMTTLLLASAAQASTPAINCAPSAEVRFIEGAPVDRFVITNLTDVALPVSEVAIDLTPSAGQLIFDTVGGGAGVEVFQPFRSDAAAVNVADGAEGVRMPLQGLAARAQVSFTIDVDDRLTTSELGQIRVSGSEMQGAVVSFTQDGMTYSGAFDAQNTARLFPGCGSNS